MADPQEAVANFLRRALELEPDAPEGTTIGDLIGRHPELAALASAPWTCGAGHRFMLETLVLHLGAGGASCPQCGREDIAAVHPVEVGHG